MLVETSGGSEQLDPFCGSLIIERLLMACRQTAGCHQIKPCSTDTCCSVDAHMCIEAGESVFNSIVHFRVCRAVYRCVLVNMTLCVCSSPYVPTHARICFCSYRLCVYVHINALSCCPGHCLLHNEGQTVEKGSLAFWWILPQTPSTLVCPLVSSSFPLPPLSFFLGLEAAASIGGRAAKRILQCGITMATAMVSDIHNTSAALLIRETKIAG